MTQVDGSVEATEAAQQAVVPAALELRNITAGYGGTLVLRDVSIRVPVGGIVALLGPNGVGKTTTLRVAGGLLRPVSGSVMVSGDDVSDLAPHQRTKKGLCLIPEGRGIFRSLTVAENLRLQIPPWADRDSSFDRAIEAFPVLGQRMGQLAGSMSGGQQQMLALARAYLSEPSVVLLDEVSIGLSPLMVDEVFATMRTLAATGLSLMIVEQYVTRALELANQIVLLHKGAVAFEGPPSMLDEAALLSNYLGVDETSTLVSES